MTITSDDVKLKSIDELKQILSTTEPLSDLEFYADGAKTSPTVKFTLPPGYNIDLENKLGTQLTDATVDVGGNELKLTKDALLQATSAIGLTKQYVVKSPADHVDKPLNYWMNNMPNTAFKFLTVKDQAVAMTKASVTPVSNLKILDAIIAGIKETYKVDQIDLQADYKLHHDLRQSFYRIIIPEKSRQITTARKDNPSDKWSIGIDVTNSLTAEKGLRARGYMFNWSCTNGQISTHASSGTWSRKNNPSEQQALDWMQGAIDNILGGLEHELDNVEKLVQIEIEGEVNDTLQDVFEKYKVPPDARKTIIALMIDNDDLTMYGLQAAITQVANDPATPAATATKLMEIGGDLPSSASGRCKSCHRLPIS